MGVRPQVTTRADGPAAATTAASARPALYAVPSFTLASRAARADWLDVLEERAPAAQPVHTAATRQRPLDLPAAWCSRGYCDVARGWVHCVGARFPESGFCTNTVELPRKAVHHSLWRDAMTLTIKVSATALSLVAALLVSSPSTATAGDRHLSGPDPSLAGPVGQTGAFPPLPGLNSLVFTTGQAQFESGVPNQGWWSNVTANYSANANYVVGRCCVKGAEYRNFFTFDLSSLHQYVVFARLDVFSHESGGDAIERLRLFDVSTPPATLNLNDGVNPRIFADLGTGTSYGTFNVDTSQVDKWLSFRLDIAAVRALNDSAGDFFSIGGRLLSAAADSRTDEFLFGNSSSTTVRLVVKTVPIPLR